MQEMILLKEILQIIYICDEIINISKNNDVRGDVYVIYFHFWMKNTQYQELIFQLSEE